jgi:peptidoglycan/xylan/chitin deacetylase (PgdA/CDA1 family)
MQSYNLMMTILRHLIASAVLIQGATWLSAQARTVAITVDDLPFVSGGESLPQQSQEASWAERSNHQLLTKLQQKHVPVTGFVNEKGVEELGNSTGSLILKEWIDRGFDLGNHTYSHPSFNDLTVEQFEDEIVRGEKTYEPLMKGASRPDRFFRFPFNNTGDTKEKHDAIAEFLAKRGYRTAPCTIEDEDWAFNATYFRANTRHDSATAKKVREAYLAYAAAEIDYYAALNKQVMGYEPPQIMLLHDNPLNADVMDDLLNIFKQRGYRFVSLAQAEADPAYRAPETFITRFGPMWGYRWARERDVKVNGKLETEPPAWISQYGADSPARAQ